MQRFWRNFLRGYGSVGTLFPDTASRHRVRLAKLRTERTPGFQRDWPNISGDFHRVIQKMAASGKLPTISSWQPNLQNLPSHSQPLPVNGHRSRSPGHN